MEESGVRPPTLLRRRPATVVAVLTSFGLIIGLLKNFLGRGTFGIDFGVFYVGGSRIASDGYEAAYDNEAFTEQLFADHFPSLIGERTVSHFVSSPPFGWFAQALSWASFDVSLGLWLAVGVAALVASIRLLGLPWWSTLFVLISPAMALNTMLGQTAPFILLLFVFLHRATHEENYRAAGAIAGLLILKPPMAFGYGLLWLIKRGRYLQSIVVSALVGVLVALPTLLGGFGPWTAFFGSMSERAEAEGSWIQQSPSIPEFLKLLVPFASSTATLGFWAAGLAVGAVVIVAGARKYDDDPEMLSALAVVATVFASPHLLVYDSIIVLIPVAVAYRRGLLTGDRAGLLAAIYAVGVAFGPELFVWQYQQFGRGIGLETLAVVACAWLLMRWQDEATGPTHRSLANEESGAVLADA